MRRAVWIERMKGGMQNLKKERQRTKLCSPTIQQQMKPFNVRSFNAKGRTFRCVAKRTWFGYVGVLETNANNDKCRMPITWDDWMWMLWMNTVAVLKFGVIFVYSDLTLILPWFARSWNGLARNCAWWFVNFEIDSMINSFKLSKGQCWKDLEDSVHQLKQPLRNYLFQTLVYDRPMSYFCVFL